MKKTKLATAIAAGGILAFGLAAGVRAEVLGTSFINMTNFIINGTDGQPLDYNTDFSVLTFTSSANVSAELGGVGTSTSSTVAPIDLAQVSQGTPPAIAENTFPVISSAAGYPVTNYALADQYEAGAPIDNVPLNGSTFPLGADVASSAYVGIATGSTDASAESNNNLNASWIFALSQDQGITFTFDAEAYLEAFSTAEEIFPGFGTAAYAFIFEISDQVTGDQYFEWKPDGTVGTGIIGGTETLDPFTLNRTRSVNAPPLTGTDLALWNGAAYGVANSGSFSATTGTLNALCNYGSGPTACLYQLSARITTLADAKRVAVPEPSAIALMGIGLLGIAVARLRRRSA